MRAVTLEERYEAAEGRVLLSGIQALVRLPLDHRRRDAMRGLETAGFISGYRGSPLGTYDSALGQARDLMDRHGIVVRPGLNEDLAATAVWGTQQVGLFPGARFAGVFGIWYGKSPGVDRTGDVFKHANFAGTSRLGGVLAVAGDDPSCKSSSLPSQSDYAFVDAEMPLLAPSSVSEILEFGLLGLAMSRYAGCWAAMKTTADLMDGSATVDLQPFDRDWCLPDRDAVPRGSRHIERHVPPQELEARHRRLRLPASVSFARANGVNRALVKPRSPRIAIVAGGNGLWHAREALALLGLDDERAGALGIMIYGIGLLWPLDAVELRTTLAGLEEVVVVEEKRDLIESQLRAALFDLPEDRRPRIVGKTDERGAPLISDLGALSTSEVANALRERLTSLFVDLDLGLAPLPGRPMADAADLHRRAPYFCSGCPHNGSTKVPDGSRALAGIGCHYLVQGMERSTQTFTQMGGEGITWVGQAPFTDEKHVFVNLGDGTYFHSGVLAIRQAVAARVNVTYKILFNGAVAMTGGQPVDGELSVPVLMSQLLAEGVTRIALLEDQPGSNQLPDFSSAVVTRHRRDELDRVQRELREHDGVSVIVYDQPCATELRRRRKRGLVPERTKFAYINEAVCEGCGDCTRASNCLSIVPVETELGRKRTVDQSSCNSDLACLEGFCPSFVTVEGGRRRRPPVPADSPALEEPNIPQLSGPRGILLTGVGGQGVTSVAAILAMAAHMEGREVRTMDVLGMAQKGGGVASFIRIGRAGDPIHAPAFADGCADLVLAGDAVVTAAAGTLRFLDPSRTSCVLNADVLATAEFVLDQDKRFPSGPLARRIGERSASLSTVAATTLASARMGDAIFGNVILLGFAWQRGLVPIGGEALRAAIRLNGVAVDANLRAFELGRVAALSAAEMPKEAVVEEPLPQLIARRRAFLTEYQDDAYGTDYARFVEQVARAEDGIAPGSQALARAVAEALFKLMAYKDEYEVARLYSHPDFARRLRETFEGNLRLSVHLAPPLLTRPDPRTGRLRKRAFGPWILVAFRLLACARRIRGTWVDPFGRTAERREERTSIGRYRADVEMVLALLTPELLPLAVELAELPIAVRGFGPVKASALERTLKRRQAILRLIDERLAPESPVAQKFSLEENQMSS
jgi:indolepyruvate ferredoxin oxidoreductase